MRGLKTLDEEILLENIKEAAWQVALAVSVTLNVVLIGALAWRGIYEAFVR